MERQATEALGGPTGGCPIERPVGAKRRIPAKNWFKILRKTYELNDENAL